MRVDLGLILVETAGPARLRVVSIILCRLLFGLERAVTFTFSRLVPVLPVFISAEHVYAPVKKF